MHAFRTVKEQLRMLPDHGLGYSLLRYLDPEAGPVLAQFPKAPIGFNYLGQLNRG